MENSVPKSTRSPLQNSRSKTNYKTTYFPLKKIQKFISFAMARRLSGRLRTFAIDSQGTRPPNTDKSFPGQSSLFVPIALKLLLILSCSALTGNMLAWSHPKYIKLLTGKRALVRNVEKQWGTVSFHLSVCSKANFRRRYSMDYSFVFW